MPSPAYTSLLNLVSLYVDSKKAAEVVDRQVISCKLNRDTMSGADIKVAALRVVTACCLYVSDQAKRDELKTKVLAL